MKRLISLFWILFLVSFFGCAALTSKNLIDESVPIQRPQIEKLTQEGGANKIRAFTEIEGGGAGALDTIPCASLAENDLALAFDVNSNKAYLYWFNDGDTTAENSPFYIRPDNYAACGDGVWFKLPDKQNIISSAVGYNLSVEEGGSLLLMTAAGEVGFPDCNATNIGLLYEVMNKTSPNQIELVMNGDLVNDHFVLIDGTVLDNNDEADLSTDASSRAIVKCLETNAWYITSAVGVVTDGGAAD